MITRMWKISRRLTARNTIHIVSLLRLNRALAQVWRELRSLGFATPAIHSVPVRLGSPLGFFSAKSLFNTPYGFFEREGKIGGIVIPSVSMSALSDLLNGRQYTSLRDVLRHEYAHALEHHHGELIHNERFIEAFGAEHDTQERAEFDPEYFVSEYAATCVAQEDYAETFMFYVKHGGVLPSRFKTRPIRRKWRFIGSMAATLRGQH